VLGPRPGRVLRRGSAGSVLEDAGAGPSGEENPAGLLGTRRKRRCPGPAACVLTRCVWKKSRCHASSWHRPALLSLLGEAAFPGRTPPRRGVPALVKAGPIPAADDGGLEPGAWAGSGVTGTVPPAGKPRSPRLPRWAVARFALGSLPCSARVPRCPESALCHRARPAKSEPDGKGGGWRDKRALSFGWGGP